MDKKSYECLLKWASMLESYRNLELMLKLKKEQEQ